MNILLTSVGRRTYLVHYFLNALKNEGKVFASNSVMTYAMSQADGYVITPPIYDKGYITFIIDYCKSKHISANFWVLAGLLRYLQNMTIRQ